MKRLSIFLMILFCGICINSAYAQKTKVVQKAYKGVKSILKDVKTPKKVPKIPKEKNVIEEKQCSNCKGSGVVAQYNPYSNSFYNVYCSTCSGRGKVFVSVKKIVWE